jgi:hypothetical protein
VNLDNDGLALWYGTPDAPAPGDAGIAPRRGASLVVGVHPANPTNAVQIRFRVDGGLVRTLPSRELRTDYARQAQYFAATFPPFPTGNVVEYLPILTCGGRQVPSASAGDRFPSHFRLEQAPAAPARAPRPAPVGAATASQLRFAADLKFVADVAVQFTAAQFVGDTPAGARVNFVVRDGTVTGAGFTGKVLEGSADDLIVRPDGMGVIRIRAAFELSDGAMLDVEAGGYVDFGPDAYRRALAHDLPDRSPLVLTPLITTRHPKYRWLTRIQCIGVGETHLDAGQATYHVYAVGPRALT